MPSLDDSSDEFMNIDYKLPTILNNSLLFIQFLCGSGCQCHAIDSQSIDNDELQLSGAEDYPLLVELDQPDRIVPDHVVSDDPGLVPALFRYVVPVLTALLLHPHYFYFLSFLRFCFGLRNVGCGYFWSFRCFLNSSLACAFEFLHSLWLMLLLSLADLL